MARVEKAIKIRPAGWAHPFARLVPESWRRAHHWYAVRSRKFWLPCPLCGHEFGGHERRSINGLSTDIADPKYPTGSGRGLGICPACTRAGHGVDTLLAAPALPEEQPMEKCANCGMPIVPCEIGYTHMPDGWMVECDEASPTRTRPDESIDWDAALLNMAGQIMRLEPVTYPPGVVGFTAEAQRAGARIVLTATLKDGSKVTGVRTLEP